MIKLPKKSLNLVPVVDAEVIPLFNYNGVDTAAVKEIEATATSFRAREQEFQKAGIEHAVRQGKLLMAAKEALGHGLFTKWVETRLGVSDQTGRNYMNAAKAYGDKTQMVLDVPLAVAYKLAASTTPTAVKEKVLAALESGQKIAPDQILKEITEAKAKVAEAKPKADLKVDLDLIERMKKAGFTSSLDAIAAAFPDIDIWAEGKNTP